ncbi:hypothetical protein RIR_jg8686.t1 [Rhizophagus irregularis DAOM 181602=DAOM 197198]|nr:hypothetical protein RIR_jg8686.t1 [Rhizophagus irregularis DAOM 181602=DAOM 197198]
MTKITNIHNRSLHGHLTKAIWHVNNDALKAWEIVGLHNIHLRRTLRAFFVKDISSRYGSFILLITIFKLVDGSRIFLGLVVVLIIRVLVWFSISFSIQVSILCSREH